MDRTARGLLLTAKPLTDEEHRAIEEKFSNILNLQVSLTQCVHEELIGGVRVELLGRDVKIGGQRINLLSQLIVVARRVGKILNALECLLLGELLVRANGVVHDRGEVGGHVNLVVRAHEIGGGASGVAILVRLKTAVQLLVHRLGDFGPGGVVNAGRA